VISAAGPAQARWVRDVGSGIRRIPRVPGVAEAGAVPAAAAGGLACGRVLRAGRASADVEVVLAAVAVVADVDTAYLGLLLALLVLRRWRHRLVRWVAFTLGSIPHRDPDDHRSAAAPVRSGPPGELGRLGDAIGSSKANKPGMASPGPPCDRISRPQQPWARPGDLLVIGPAVTQTAVQDPDQPGDGALTWPPLKLGWPAPAI
jgi:hypothetical protein